MMMNDITGVDMGNFTLALEKSGKNGPAKSIELEKGGENKPITQENKFDYVKKIIECRLGTMVKIQLDGEKGGGSSFPAETALHCFHHWLIIL